VFEERNVAIRTFGGYALWVWTVCLVAFALRIRFNL